jgi:hypothetical protein
MRRLLSGGVQVFMTEVDELLQSMKEGDIQFQPSQSKQVFVKMLRATPASTVRAHICRSVLCDSR